MEKLIIKEIAGYLPYNLQVAHGETIKQITAVRTDGPFIFCNTYIGSRQKQMLNISEVRPLLYPLEMLTKTIVHNGVEIIPINELKGLYGWTWLWENRNDLSKFNSKAINHCVIEHLQMWHIDYQNLIGQGKATDKSTLTP